MPEIRAEIPAEELAVLDGYCMANGKNRTEIIVGLLKEWSKQKLHESILICRVAGINPTDPDGSGVPLRGNRTGSSA